MQLYRAEHISVSPISARPSSFKLLPLRQINPSGKISLFPKGKSPLRITPSCPHWKGRWPSSPNVGMGCGGRSGIVCGKGLQGGINSVSDHRPCRRAVPKRTAKSCGPGAARLAPSLRTRSQATVATERSSPGRVRISRKAIAQGMSDVLRCPVCSCAPFSHNFAHETAGAARIRLSLRPLTAEGVT